jgi:hypothetical protein
MKSKQLPLLLALTFLFNVAAHAGRDEALIAQTRKNQLAHDAKVEKEKQEKQATATAREDANPSQVSPQVPNNDGSASPSTPAKP